MNLAGRLEVPDGTRVLLLDLDGVLLDSLSLDLALVPQMLARRWPNHGTQVTPSQITARFAEPVGTFWESLLGDLGVTCSREEVAALAAEHERVRAGYAFEVLPGMRDIIVAARDCEVQVVAVSNNREADIRSMLAASGIAHLFDHVVGLDSVDGAAKPDPALYCEAVRVVGAPPVQCVALEDSLAGLASARGAGCTTLAVATGAATFAELEQSGLAQRVLMDMRVARVEVGFTDPRNRSLVSANEFVTHMVEHIFWRLGLGGRVDWPSDDWSGLGAAIGRALAGSLLPAGSSAVLGMIDDGSCEVVIDLGGQGVHITGAYDVDVEWFLSLPVEQVAHGRVLVDLMRGLSSGVGASISVRVCSLEDPHHTWEGVFRSLGMCLRQLLASHAGGAASGGVLSPTGPTAHGSCESTRSVEDTLDARYGWRFSDVTSLGGVASRSTAESEVLLSASFSGRAGCSLHAEVSDSIPLGGFEALLDALARAAGLHLTVSFRATALSSSHVVFEDVGLTLGKVLLQVAQQRWRHLGMSGFGSSISVPGDLEALTRVAISIEGRKFWKFVALEAPYSALRRGMLVGRPVRPDLRSEGLDDFIDGLAGGLGASIMVHVASFDDPSSSWWCTFSGLGTAIGRAFAADPLRVGLPPGVKATLV